MALLTKELLKSKLSDWTLSCKVCDTLGLTADAEAQVKSELFALEEKGLVERDGVRRGLKFRYKPSSDVVLTEDSEESDEPLVISAKEIGGFVAAPIEGYVRQKDRDKDITGKAVKDFKELLKFVVSSSPEEQAGISSYTLAIKKNNEGIVLKIYSGITTVSEHAFTVPKFVKFVKESGVLLDV